MKCRVGQAVMITVLVGMFLPGIAQKNYYVVVGAFSTEGNAKDFTTYLPKLNADTAYAMSEQENVVQLYVLRTSNENVAIAKSQKLQTSLEEMNSSVAGNYETVSTSKLEGAKMVTVKNDFAPVASEKVLSDASSSRTSSSSGAAMPSAPMKPKGKIFKFTISDPLGQTMNGNVHYVDFQRELDLASYSANAYTDILNPGKFKDMAVVCGLFGYKQTEKYINYADPSSNKGVFQDENGAWVIPYQLKRLEKGDVSVMYNVNYHKDAVVMLPQSKTDLEELLKMMVENPDYEITIHGHCNGKNDRKIIIPGHDQDLFDIQGSRQFYGSAKELSTLRANAIMHFLLRNGIDERRIRIYAWGGRYMLVSPESSTAKLNDRIEIEIRKD